MSNMTVTHAGLKDRWATAAQTDKTVQALQRVLEGQGLDLGTALVRRYQSHVAFLGNEKLRRVVSDEMVRCALEAVEGCAVVIEPLGVAGHAIRIYPPKSKAQRAQQRREEVKE